MGQNKFVNLQGITHLNICNFERFNSGMNGFSNENVNLFC